MRFGLTQLPRKLSEVTGKSSTYRQCFDAAVNGRFPAQFANSRWTVDEADLPQIAAALGMIPTGTEADPCLHVMAELVPANQAQLVSDVGPSDTSASRRVGRTRADKPAA
jgi:hypothetical protein